MDIQSWTRANGDGRKHEVWLPFSTRYTLSKCVFCRSSLPTLYKVNVVHVTSSPLSPPLHQSVSSKVQRFSYKAKLLNFTCCVVVAVTVARYVQTPSFTAHARPSVMTWSYHVTKRTFFGPLKRRSCRSFTFPLLLDTFLTLSLLSVSDDADGPGKSHSVGLEA